MTRARYLTIVAVFLLLMPASGRPQADDAEKLKQKRLEAIVNQVLSDEADLKLGENRAFLMARMGNIVWKSDPKQARSMFQTAVNELIRMQEQAEADRNTGNGQFDSLYQNTRTVVLNQIAIHDAAFALDVLHRSRPTLIQRAMTAADVKTSKLNEYSNNYAYLAQNETVLEQTLMRLAADQAPERSVKLLKDSLARGITGETFNLLKKLAEKDQEAAAGVADELIGKALEKGFLTDGRPDYQKLNFAQSLLADLIREKPPGEKYLPVDTARAKTLADKFLSYYLDQGTRNGGTYYPAILPIAEKLSPSYVSRLKQLAKSNPNQEFGYIIDPDASKLISSDLPPDQLAAAARKFSPASRREIVQSAAAKYMQAGNMPSAVALLNDNFSNEALGDALNNLSFQYFNILTSAGKFAEAETVIEDLTPSSRFSAYISLANSIFGANPELNRSAAEAVLAKAQAMLPERCETGNDLSLYTQLINAYTTIRPEEAFRLSEALVPQLNELSEATAVLGGFQGSGVARKGELLLTQGSNFGVYVDLSPLRALAANDFDRTMRLIDSFSRREVRIAIKLQLAEYQIY